MVFFFILVIICKYSENYFILFPDMFLYDKYTGRILKEKFFQYNFLQNKNSEVFHIRNVSQSFYFCSVQNLLTDKHSV